MKKIIGIGLTIFSLNAWISCTPKQEVTSIVEEAKLTSSSITVDSNGPFFDKVFKIKINMPETFEPYVMLDAIDQSGKYIAMTPTPIYSAAEKVWNVEVLVSKTTLAQDWNVKVNDQLLKSFKLRNEVLLKSFELEPNEMTYSKPITIKLAFSQDDKNVETNKPAVFLDALDNAGKYVALTPELSFAKDEQKWIIKFSIAKDLKAANWNLKINDEIVKAIEIKA